MQARNHHQTVSHPFSRLVGFFLGAVTGALANLLGIPFFILTLLRSIYKGTDSLVKTGLLTTFVLLIMLPFFIVMAPAALLYSIKNGMETGASKSGGFSAAFFFPVTYLTKFLEGIETAGKVGGEYLFDTRFFSAMMNHLFLPFLASAEVAKAANWEEVDQLADGFQRDIYLPEDYFGGDPSFYSDSTVAVYTMPSAPPPPPVQLDYDNINIKLKTLTDLKPDESKLPVVDQNQISTLSPACRQYVLSRCPLSNESISELKDPLTVEWKGQSVPITYSQNAIWSSPYKPLSQIFI